MTKGKIVLLKDLVIPAGTVFSEGPVMTLHPKDCMESIHGIGKDFSFSISVSALDALEKAEGFFTILK